MDYLSGRIGANDPYQRQLLQGFFGGAGTPGLFGQGLDFTGSLLRGEIPESLRATTAENLAEAQKNLNSQLQLRGGFFGTPGLQLQSQLARQSANDLNNLVFGNAMQGLGLGTNLYGAGAGLAGGADVLGPSLGLLSQLRGQVYQPPMQQQGGGLGGLLGGLAGMFLPGLGGFGGLLGSGLGNLFGGGGGGGGGAGIGGFVNPPWNQFPWLGK